MIAETWHRVKFRAVWAAVQVIAVALEAEGRPKWFSLNKLSPAHCNSFHLTSAHISPAQLTLPHRSADGALWRCCTAALMCASLCTELTAVHGPAVPLRRCLMPLQMRPMLLKPWRGYVSGTAPSPSWAVPLARASKRAVRLSAIGVLLT